VLVSGPVYPQPATAAVFAFNQDKPFFEIEFRNIRNIMFNLMP
jgi:hypothetical protein